MTPQTVSHYQILDKLGAGGMGEVYLAEDTVLRRRVAIKFLAQQLMSEERAKRRFLREAHIAAALDHPNICAIYEIGEESGRRFAVMQYVEGETLDVRSRNKSLRLNEVVRIAVQIATALTEAHDHEIIHRDIKPQNIIINSRGDLKVLDFGLSKFIYSGNHPEAKTQSLLSESGMVIGTMPYMSPEQLRDEELDFRSDLFSFGVLLYELATGEQPFARSTSVATISAILNHEPLPLRAVNPSTPQALEEIVDKCLKKKREDRYQSARQLLADLRSLAADASQAETMSSRLATLLRTNRGSRSGRDRWFAYAATALTLTLIVSVALYYFFAGRWWTPSNRVDLAITASSINSIAVLPFINESAEPNTEYLSDGLTDSLMNNLAHLPRVKVIARSSVFRYKGRQVDAQTVGRELNVQAVLMGRVKLHGDDLLIIAELVNALDNSLIWIGQYPQKLARILEIEERIAREISDRLRSTLSGEEKALITRRHTEDVEAYQLYLRGRYDLNKRTNPSKAIEYFKKAIERDPAYAQAYAGLADAYAALALGLYEGPPPMEMMPRSKAAALKALEIDETLAEAHVSLALTKMQYDWDWPGAESELLRAIKLNPNYAPARQSYVLYHLIMGRFDDAIAESKKAHELDPLSLAIYTNVARALYYSRKYDLAIEQINNVIELDKNSISAYFMLGLCYENKGMYKEAIAAFQTTIPLTKNAPWSVAALGHAYAVSGRRNEALKIIKQLKDQSRHRYISPFHIGAIYNGLGDKEQAFEWFEKAYQNHSGLIAYLKIEPEFDALRTDPRYVDLMRRIGLEK